MRRISPESSGSTAVPPTVLLAYVRFTIVLAKLKELAYGEVVKVVETVKNAESDELSRLGLSKQFWNAWSNPSSSSRRQLEGLRTELSALVKAISVQQLFPSRG